MRQRPRWEDLGWGLRPQPAAVVRDHLRRGLSTGQGVGELLPRVSSRWPWLPAVQQGETSLTLAEVSARVEAVASLLARGGVDRGSVVCWQLPTWWEAYVLNLAIWRLGAVSAPVVMILREAELAQIFAELQPSAVVTCGAFRSTTHTDLFEAALTAAGVQPASRIVVRGQATGWSAFDEPEAAIAPPAVPVAPDDPCLVMFTSGTTSAAKGVVHTSRSVIAEARQLVAERGFSWEDTTYTPTPLAHAAGLYLGLVVPVLTGGRALLDDAWDAARACEVIERERVNYCVGATLFLEELTAAAAAGADLRSLRNFACGGAAIPLEAMERAEAVGIPATRGYGMTELPTATLSNRSLPEADRFGTDGPVAEGVEMRIEAIDGMAEGEILVRGPERMAGYLRPGDSDAALDADGWFRTGDLGRIDRGLLTVTGRIKEIINRGGEKFSAREIEDVLSRHAGVVSATVVAAPDQRFGEVPAAWIVGAAPGLTPDSLAAYLREAGLARQKTPVHWRFVDTLPRTASGKVNRAQLAASIRDQVDALG